MIHSLPTFCVCVVFLSFYSALFVEHVSFCSIVVRHLFSSFICNQSVASANLVRYAGEHFREIVGCVVVHLCARQLE